jgi:hypothetical protein
VHRRCCTPDARTGLVEVDLGRPLVGNWPKELDLVGSGTGHAGPNKIGAVDTTEIALAETTRDPAVLVRRVLPGIESKETPADRDVSCAKVGAGIATENAGEDVPTNRERVRVEVVDVVLRVAGQRVGRGRA